MTHVRGSRLVRLVAVLLPLAALGLASAAPGDLDLTFNPLGAMPGVVVLDVGATDNNAHAVAIQSDGRIVVGGGSGGGVTVFRLDPTGTLDPTFGGGDGIVVTPVGGGSPEITGLAIQPDGKIVVGGRNTGSGGFTVVRYDAGGNPDPGFGGGDGIVETVFAQGPADAWALALQADGKIVVAGEVAGSVALARYSGLDGSPDLGFGIGGTVVSAFGVSEGALAVAMQADGKIVVVGAGTGAVGLDFFVARFNSDGSPDTSFDGDGFVLTDFSDLFPPILPAPSEVAAGLVIQPDGKIVVAGYYEEVGGGGDTFLLARYNADGSLDPTFGVGGRVLGPSGFSAGVVLQPDGKIVVGGSQNGDFAVVRFDAGGALDGGFGVGGVVTHDIGGNAFDAIVDVALQPDGQIVAVGDGLSATSLDLDAVVARYTNPPTIDSAGATPSLLWPPNHKMLPVEVTVEASDEIEAPTCSITEISSSEPVNGPGDGNTAPDWLITGPLTADLRAERSGSGGGRLYTLTVECVDLADNATTTQVVVTVPHSKKN